MLLVGYLRVSTSDQSVDSAGQRHGIELWAVREGHEIAEWYADEGVSGSRGLEQRPGLAAAFELCRVTRRRRRSRIDGVVAFDPSRFARDRNLAGHLRWTAKALAFDMLTADGRLDTRRDTFEAAAVDTIADLLNEQARQAIRKATRAALAVRRDGGLIAGHVPYGYRREGNRLEVNNVEAAVVRRVLDLRSEGRTFRAIGVVLNDCGVVTRRGSKWSGTAVLEVSRGRMAQSFEPAQAIGTSEGNARHSNGLVADAKEGIS
jgi:DNA invertase Pin-like site-specific DNA recombinase